MNINETLDSYYGMLDPREQARIKNTIKGAYELDKILDQAGPDAAKQYLYARKQQLSQQMSVGQPVDTQETDAALQMIEAGDIQGLRGSIKAIISAGGALGIE